MGIINEVVVYSSLPLKKYRWISYVTIGQLGFMVVNLFAIPTPQLMAERKEKKFDANKVIESQPPSEFVDENPTKDDKPNSIWRSIGMNAREIFSISNITANIFGRPFFSGGLIMASSLITFCLVFRARRAIHMITLLPQDKVRISTFSVIALGKPPTIEIPLSYVSCLQPREANTNYTMLKIKGRMGVFLIDKSDGRFHEPNLFDQHLGYARSWAAR